MEKKFCSKLYNANYSLTSRWFVYYKDPATGKRVKVYGNINRQKTVEARIAVAEAIQADLAAKYRVTAYSDTKQRLLDGLEARRSTWKRKTYQCRHSKLKIFLKWMEGREFVEQEIHNFFLRYLTEQKQVSGATYNNYLTHIRVCLRWVGLDGLVAGIQKRKENSTPAQYFTDSQRKFLVAEMAKRNPDLLFFVQFVYYCFIRPRSELRMLKVGDIIMEDNRILIRQEVSKNNKQQYVAIPFAFAKIVEQKTSSRNPNAWLFPSPVHHGKPIGKNTYPEQHRALLKELGFDTARYKLYSWKHTGAVACVRAGVNLKELQIQLRHYSLDQVDDYLRQLGVADLIKLQTRFPGIQG